MFKSQRILLLAGFFWLCGGNARAQVDLRVQSAEAEASELTENLGEARTFPDSLAVLAFLEEGLQNLRMEAYWEASIDHLVWQDSTCTAHFHLGPPYEWASLNPSGVPSFILDAIGFREKLYRGKPLQISRLRELQDRLLTYASDHGYPFAQVALDSVRVDAGIASARLTLKRGPLILIEKLEVEGDAQIGTAYLTEYLGLRTGEPYNNSKVLRIRNRIQELSFLKLAKDPIVTFVNGKARILLILNKRRASRFDFILGVLPQSESGRQANGRSVLITGSFTGELRNQFKLGERIFASFEQLRPETQELELAFDYPYILNLPIGADLGLELYKRDTSYLDLITNVGAQYLFEGGNYVQVFWDNRSSSLLNVDERQLESQGQLPTTLDVRNASFGMEGLWQQLDYRFNPRRGWAAYARAGAGRKRIQRNNQIVELGYGELYDSLQLRSYQYRLRARLEGYLPLFRSSTLKGQVTGGAIIGEQPVFFNEQFRIGGNRLLRGFDEESVFATQFAVATAEYRLLIGQNSYLYTFGDWAWVVDRTPTMDVTDRPYGFGAGITFEVSVGVFGVSIAYGSRLGNPLDLSAPKVHFGYVSLF